MQRAKRDSSDAQSIVTDWKPAERSSFWRGKRVVLGVVGFALILFLILQLSRYFSRSSGEAIDSIAVLPFVNMSGNPDTDYLSDGITESLIDSLSELPNLKVISHSGVFRYKGAATDPRTAGRELGVRAVLTGRVTQRGDRLSVGAELVKVEDNTALWGEQYNSKLADALALQSDIATRISEKLRLKLSNEQKTRLAKRQTGNPEAYQLYLKGRYYTAKFTTDELAKGQDYFQGLMHLDYDFDWAAAEREFRRALDLNANYAPAHEYYAWYLVSVGRIDESLTQIRRAEQLDPLSPEITSLAGWFLYFARHYDESVAELRKCLDLDRNYWLDIISSLRPISSRAGLPKPLQLLKRRGKSMITLRGR